MSLIGQGTQGSGSAQYLFFCCLNYQLSRCLLEKISKAQEEKAVQGLRSCQ